MSIQSPEIALFLALNAGPDSAPLWIAIARWITDWLPALSLCSLALAGLVTPRARVAVLRTALALLLGWLGARLLREGLQWPRPAALGLGRQWIDHSGGPGLPSMHATCAFAFAFALRDACRSRGWHLAAFAIAVSIAWSRLFLGVHFPSDVLAGLLVGAAAAYTVTRLWDGAGGLRARLVRRRLAATPAAASFNPVADPAGR